ncbi:FAD-dependent oxidoreductase [Pseudoxanthomonas suwonensis]|uniref:FAD-dependent oxidoreductase n=1 Tax=Pseudoxanthomonas suwonensis TaxID=314722 RepID=UPI00138F3F56|nr:FAD-dependent oxidoreductase [Pseudoxanthomonas suwonensis]KAF1704056.1 FAD-dependent oxidoreductase [Pseudoxanthomonas suwonensis]
MSTALTIPVWAPIGDATAGWFETQAPAGAQDVVVVGAGIAGLTTAACLLREGRQVLVIDREGVGAGETLRTTAHLASALDDRFTLLQRHHGKDGARLAAASHAVAIDWIEDLAAGAPDCGFRRVPGYLYSHKGDTEGLRQEMEAARESGLEVRWCEAGEELPARFGPAIRFAGQARLDAGGYLLALAREVRDAGGRFLRANVERVTGGDEPALHLDDNGVLRARAVVVAANVPFHGTTATFPKQAPYRTYVVAGRVPAGTVPDALVWDDADPYHYVRLRETADPAWMELLVGGEDHKTGQDDDPEAYARLQAWTRERFPQVESFHAAWSGQVLEPADGLAFIGADPHHDNVWLITGDSGNGMTHGTLGGLLVTDLVQGRDNPWRGLYDPGRQPLRAGGEWLRENVNAVLQYRDWVRPAQVSKVEDISPGSGAVLRRGLHRVAVYRAGDGAVHAYSARCTHMGCVVRWSSEEKSWDCPCHGSRFDARSGVVLNGPANAPLEPYPLEDGD